jgi:hypothetical protein
MPLEDRIKGNGVGDTHSFEDVDDIISSPLGEGREEILSDDI